MLPGIGIPSTETLARDQGESGPKLRGYGGKHGSVNTDLNHRARLGGGSTRGVCVEGYQTAPATLPPSRRAVERGGMMRCRARIEREGFSGPLSHLIP